MGRQWISLLKKLDACPEAIVWAEKYKSLDLAWSKCKRGDWMLWVVGKSCETENDKKLLVLATCECARLSATAAYYAAYYATDAASAASAARTDILKICADIIRKYYPDPPKF
jgi:hypothetical protein